MRTGKLSISRGRGSSGAASSGPRLSIVARASAAPEPALSPEYRAVHDRLSALERLARLHDQGALTDEEFAAEKAAILGDPNELVLNEPLIPAEPAQGPSLLARQFGWRIIPVGLLAGLGLSYASQPRETLRFFEDALRLFGA
jgi:hypothetical protein